MRRTRLSRFSVFILSVFVTINLLGFTTVQAATTGQAIVNYGRTFIGTPYVWGGTTPSGFDCSGFVQYVYNHFAISLPRTANEQSKVGTQISKANLQLGDIVCFDWTHDGTIDHVGIYTGNGYFVQAQGSQDNPKYVNEEHTVNESYYSNGFVYARRLSGVVSFNPIVCYAFTEMKIMDKPDVNSNRIGTYAVGEQFTLIGEVGNWWQTNHGYIQKYTYTPSNTLLIMNSPNGTRIGTYAPGESFSVISASGDWWRTIHGWIKVNNVTSYTTLLIMNSPNGTRIGTYATGEAFTILCENGAWWQTNHGFVQKRSYTASTITPIMGSPNGTRTGTYAVDESFIVIAKVGDWWQTNHGYVSALNVKSTITVPIMDSPNGTRVGYYVPGEAFSIIGENGIWWQTNHGWIRKI